MTFETLLGKLIMLREIAIGETTHAEQARKVLEKDATTHNLIYIDTIIDGYERNRKLG
jgi:hypothetical protein